MVINARSLMPSTAGLIAMPRWLSDRCRINLRPIRFAAHFAILSLLTLCGCGAGNAGPKTYPVSGVVTLKGAPMADADVIFVPDSDGAQAAFGKTDASGVYKLEAVEGNYKIKVSKLDTPKQAGSGKVFASSEEEVEVYNPSDGDKVQIAKNLVPKKFTDHNSSGLNHTVSASATTFDIKLD